MTRTDGNKPPLRLPQVTAMYVGSVLGSGILIIPGIVGEVAGPASLIAWGIMAIPVIPMALTMGLLSARHPNSGGVSHFVSTAFTPRLGSLIGWFFLMSVVIGAPVLALTGAGYICEAFGLGDAPRLALAAAILAAGLAVNHLGLRVAGGVQSAVVIAILTVLAITVGSGVGRVQPAHFSPFMPHGWGLRGRSPAAQRSPTGSRRQPRLAHHERGHPTVCEVDDSLCSCHCSRLAGLHD